MHGAFAVLPIFRRQNRGVLINNISLGGWAPAPFAAAYSASKFGLRGFTASLRQELVAYRDIHVCSVFPAMIDTPGFAHGANMSGRRLDPGPLLYQPDDVAAAFIRLVQHPQNEVAVGWPARAGQVSYALAPRLTEAVTGAAFRYLLSRARRADRTEGAVLESASAGISTSGGWLARRMLPAAGQITKAAAIVAVAAVLVGTLAGARRRRARLRLP
jgi:NAD(P)-dependent dehydrogenase (short-subunit alcohol dehydrogenase family)